MKHRITALAGAVLFAVTSSAFGATLRAEVEGNTLVVYLTSDKDENCFTEVRFSFQSGDKRVTRRFVCHTFARAGKDVRFCERSDPEFVDLRIEAPLSAQCGL